MRQELLEEREHVQRVKENVNRDVKFAESRAAFAEVLFCVSTILLVCFKLVSNISKSAENFQSYSFFSRFDHSVETQWSSKQNQTYKL